MSNWWSEKAWLFCAGRKEKACEQEFLGRESSKLGMSVQIQRPGRRLLWQEPMNDGGKGEEFGEVKGLNRML